LFNNFFNKNHIHQNIIFSNVTEEKQ